MNNNPDILTNVFGYDENEVEYERVTSNLRGYDLDYGIEVIFNYWRKKGFPHYQVREDEKHTHMRKLQKFDVDTIFKDNGITVECIHNRLIIFPSFYEHASSQLTLKNKKGYGKYTMAHFYGRI